MSLFGFNKKEEEITSTVKKIRPIAVQTENVAKELMKVASSNHMKVENLDFTLLEVQTFVRKNNEKEEVEFEEVEYAYFKELDPLTTLLNPDFQIKQTYEVEIFSKDKDTDPFKDLSLAVGANSTKCKIYLTIKEGSKIAYSSTLEKDLEMLINKAKMRAGILIHIFDDMVQEAINKLVVHIRIEEEVVYEETQTILIAEALEPVATVNDKLIIHFDKKEEVDLNGLDKVDYKDRNFIKNVKKDDVLIEYIKAKEGKPGRNCRGEFLKPKEAITTNQPTFNVDATIEMKDTPDKILYIATENGYISFENNIYGIKKDVDITEISFKTTGSISTGLDSDVAISVKESDSLKDAIGSGMSVEVSEINIDGNVGSNAKVSAMRAIIGGQTHKTSFVKADTLKINVHKGKAVGKEIHITRLEHGEVEGEIVRISQAVGGVIHAKEIYIENCSSYVKATASKKIEIQKIHGNENIFTINPLLKAEDGFSEHKDTIKKLEIEIKDLTKEIETYTRIIKTNTPAFNDVKKKLMHYKENGIKMPESFVNKFKQFQQAAQHLQKIKEEQEQKTAQHAMLTTRTASFQDNIFDARIINRGPWSGHNEVRVQMVEPPMLLSITPNEGSIEHIFGLVEDKYGIYEIRTVQE
ncbi:MAG: FapA family protein [Sulfurimonadaceae bacterium]|nr:FapA family protein [Sulfurimonadaceae bacterium]